MLRVLIRPRNYKNNLNVFLYENGDFSKLLASTIEWEADEKDFTISLKA